MIKKIILFIILFLSFHSTWFFSAEWSRCTWEDKLCSPSFRIKVNEISPWMDIKGGTAKANINWVLWLFIQKLMIGLWSLSFLIMTVWAWYMIIYTGQDELLNKWKSIFTSWVVALLVALSSYYIVSLLRYILYN